MKYMAQGLGSRSSAGRKFDNDIFHLIYRQDKKTRSLFAEHK